MLITSSVQIIPQEPGILGVYKQIEIGGRTAYKSEDRITEDSAIKFVNMLIERGHTAPLEQGTIYLQYLAHCGNLDEISIYFDLYRRYKTNSYSKVFKRTDDSTGDSIIYITTNARVIYENEWQNDLLFICEPTEYHEKRITVKFICSRSISHELVRHRAFSFVQESQRYCNYSKDKFGEHVTFIEPSWHTTETYEEDDIFLNACITAEEKYFELLNKGYKPQEAREVLPNATKTEVVMTGFVSQWEEFFKLRCAKSAHPDMQIIANDLKYQFIQNGII